MRYKTPTLLLVAFLAVGSAFSGESVAVRPGGALARGVMILAPLGEEPPGGNAGLFVGVNEFEDGNVSPLRFAVHDAIEQAYLFVFELKLIPPGNCCLALSGQPTAATVKEHLETLRAQKVTVTQASLPAILDAFSRVQSCATQASNVLVVAFSSHGFEDGGVPYIMPQNGRRRYLGATALKLSTIEQEMRGSAAGHRLLLVDACQERVSADAREMVAGAAGQVMTAPFDEELKKPTGQSKLTSCTLGQFSYEHPDLGGVGHGVFTFALLEALRGGAPPDAQNIVRLGAVSQYVSARVVQWVTDENRQRSAGQRAREQKPAFYGPEEGRLLPLALKADDVVTLVARVQQRPATSQFGSDLRQRLAARLQGADPQQESDRRLLAATREFLSGRLDELLFVPYLERELNRMPPTAKVPPVSRSVTGSFTVREGDEDGPLASGAEVTLHYRPSSSAAGIVLGSGTTDRNGVAQIQVTLSPSQPSGGEYVAVVVHGSARQSSPLSTFPASLNWRLYVPRPSPPPGSPPGKTLETTIGMKLVLISAGEFQMGSPEGDSSGYSDERPQHLVRIRKPFYLGVTEVTQQQYERVMVSNPSSFKGATLPVDTVSWDDAVLFCQKLKEKEGRSYRLPTEAEWEYACRAGSRTQWSFGDDESSLKEYAWYKDNSGSTTHAVGEKKPNSWGLYDMHGNVWEWCSDWNGEYGATPLDDPTGPTAGSGRVDRGGSWFNDAWFCRSAFRYGLTPGARSFNLGFRVALSLVDGSSK